MLRADKAQPWCRICAFPPVGAGGEGQQCSCFGATFWGGLRARRRLGGTAWCWLLQAPTHPTRGTCGTALTPSGSAQGWWQQRGPRGDGQNPPVPAARQLHRGLPACPPAAPSHALPGHFSKPSQISAGTTFGFNSSRWAGHHPALALHQGMMPRAQPFAAGRSPRSRRTRLRCCPGSFKQPRGDPGEFG